MRAFTLLLLPAVGGFVADRFYRRKIMLLSHTGNLLINLLLAISIGVGFGHFWQILAVGLLSGADNALDQPSRHALVAQIVPRAELQAAVGFSSVVFPASAGTQ